MIFNMVGGGTGGKAFAIIGITYPVGSTCTCTNGTKTLKLKDTSGLGIFYVPYAGTWTVTSTNGTDTDSKTIAITHINQVETASLSYIYYIIKSGLLQNDLTFITTTGKLSSQNSQTEYIQNDGYYTIKVTYGRGAYIPNINYTNYKTLHIDYTASGIWTIASVGNDNDSWADGNKGSQILGDKLTISSTKTTKTYDVSSIGIANFKIHSYACNTNLYDVYLTKD